MKNAQGYQPALTGRCEYLGLKEDSQTCLAFPSKWNYCHHAEPPESIRLDYQRQYCHIPDHVQCPIFQNEKIGHLPPEARGPRFHKKSRFKQLTRLLALLFIIALALALFWLVRSVSSMDQGGLPFETIPKLSFGTGTPLGENPLVVASPTSGIISTLTTVFTPPSNPSDTITPPTFKPLSAVVCGHLLDIPFGTKYQFIIHQAHNGESLNMYATNYQTSVDAIRAANYQLPSPLRKEWVLVIPIGESQIEKMPAFEPYLVSEANTSIENLAGKLSADPLSLEQYNGFSESCRTFSGWLLIPRQKPTP